MSDPEVDPTVGADGDMGVSSERVDATGETMGTRDTARLPRTATDAEIVPDPVSPPVAGYPSRDPRSKKHPYKPGPKT